MKYLLYLVVIAAAAATAVLPYPVAAFIGCFGAGAVGFNIYQSTRTAGWDTRVTQTSVAHGAMLFGMALIMLTSPHHATFAMKALTAGLAVTPIWYDGMELISALRRKL
ncbi:MAG: hypothetical protein RIE56_01210 [Amphiplicatus sp.]